MIRRWRIERSQVWVKNNGAVTKAPPGGTSRPVVCTCGYAKNGFTCVSRFPALLTRLPRSRETRRMRVGTHLKSHCCSPVFLQAARYAPKAKDLLRNFSTTEERLQSTRLSLSLSLSPRWLRYTCSCFRVKVRRIFSKGVGKNLREKMEGKKAIVQRMYRRYVKKIENIQKVRLWYSNGTNFYSIILYTSIEKIFEVQKQHVRDTWKIFTEWKKILSTGERYSSIFVWQAVTLWELNNVYHVESTDLASSFSR